MRTLIFAAALLAGTAAVAQTYPSTTSTTPPDATATTPTATPESAMTTTTTPDPAATATPAADPTATPPTTVSPGNTAPERDARGIAVVSDPAEAPAGFNAQGVSTGVGGPLVDASQRPAPQPATESYPACSRTVTDNCVQAYERGRSPQ